MKIKLKAPFSLNGERLEAGEHELPERIAKALIARGVAVEVKPPKKTRGGK
jgi:hypothetical protein